MACVEEEGRLPPYESRWYAGSDFWCGAELDSSGRPEIRVRVGYSVVVEGNDDEEEGVAGERRSETPRGQRERSGCTVA